MSCSTITRVISRASEELRRARGDPHVATAEPRAGELQQRELDVLARGELREQLRALVHAREAAPRESPGRLRRDVDVEQSHAAAARTHLAGKDVEQRRLAGAVRPDHGT